MEEFLTKANMIAKAAFTEWLPIFINADLGVIGAIATGLTFFGIAITIYKKMVSLGAAQRPFFSFSINRLPQFGQNFGS